MKNEMIDLGLRQGRLTIGNLLGSAARRYPDRVAFICPNSGRTCRFSELKVRVDALARGLVSLGLRKGDVVAFLGGNRIEMVEIYFALAKTGLVGLPLGPHMTPSEMRPLIVDLGVKAFLYDVKHAEKIEAVVSTCPSIGHLIPFAGEPAASAYERLISAAPSEVGDVEVDEDDPCFFNTTSGTTGAPKAFLLSHYNMLSVAPAILAFGLSSRDIVMTAFPLYGRVGIGWALISTFLGVPNVLIDFASSRVLDAIAEHKVTVVNLVPTMGTLLMRDAKCAEVDRSSLRAVIFAGSTLTAAVREEASAKLCSGVYEFYGMNEMGALCASEPGDRMSNENSVGRPLVFCEIKIVDDAGVELPTNETGEVMGRSPMTVNGYWSLAKGAVEPFVDGWVQTGDMGSLDDLGFLTLRGRKKDVIVSGGYNVHSAEVEAVLSTFSGVLECAVIGVPDNLWGEKVVAVVVVEGADLNAAALTAHCREQLNAYKVPKAFVFRRSPLPRTPTSKVKKFMLIESLGG